MDLWKQGIPQQVVLRILDCGNFSATAVFYASVTIDGTACQSANAATPAIDQPAYLVLRLKRHV
jgi:hypothetical protein